MYCTKCGEKKVPWEDDFCINCGSKFQTRMDSSKNEAPIADKDENINTDENPNYNEANDAHLGRQKTMTFLVKASSVSTIILLISTVIAFISGDWKLGVIFIGIIIFLQVIGFFLWRRQIESP